MEHARAEISGLYGPHRCLITPAGPAFDAAAVQAICAEDAHRLRWVSMAADYHRLVMRPDGVVEHQHIYPEQPPGGRAQTRCDVIEYGPDEHGRYILGDHPGPWEISDQDPGKPLPPSRAEQAEAAMRPARKLQQEARRLELERRPLLDQVRELDKRIHRLDRRARPHQIKAAELNPHRYRHLTYNPYWDDYRD